MRTYIVGLFALLALVMSGLQTFKVNSLRNELSDLREKATAFDQHEERLSTLEQQVAENRGDAAALKSSLLARSEEVAALTKKIEQRSPYGYQGLQVRTFDAKTGKTVNVMANPNAPVMAMGGPGRAALREVLIGAEPVAGLVPPPPLPETREVNPLARIPFIGDLFVKPPAAEPVAQEILQKIDPELPIPPPPLPQPTNDLTVKRLKNGTLQYQTADGKIASQVKDAWIMEKLATFPKPPVVIEMTQDVPPPATPKTTEAIKTYRAQRTMRPAPPRTELPRGTPVPKAPDAPTENF